MCAQYEHRDSFLSILTANLEVMPSESILHTLYRNLGQR